MSAVDALVLLATFCVSWLGAGAVRRYAIQSKLVDLPNTRSSHSAPIPRGGGLAIVFSFFAAATVLYAHDHLSGRIMAALIGAAAVASIGFLDDRSAQSAQLRFCVHVAAAALAVWMLGGAEFSGPIVRVVGAVFLVVALTWATNLFNFMDGIDGLAALQAIFMSASAAIINLASGGATALTITLFCLSVATLGFLRWNWPPAQLFMGDVGSGFLGFTLATLTLAVSGSTGVSLGVWAILAGVFLVDATMTLVRRMLRGDRWSEAHRMHGYQRMARRWGGHLAVTLAVAAINVAWLFPWAYFAAFHPSLAALCACLALAPLVLLALMAGSGTPS